MSKTKKQHYVPQAYLNKFSFGKKKINVFDKENNKLLYKQDIKNFAEQNYFYDIDLQYLKNHLKEVPEDLQKALDSYSDEELAYLEQYIEHQLAKTENKILPIINKIIKDAEKATPFYIKQCYCMSEEDKEWMGIYLTIQDIRTLKKRNQIRKQYDDWRNQHLSIISEIRRVHNIKEPIKTDCTQKCNIDKSKYLHLGQMIELLSNSKKIYYSTSVFRDKLWVIFINKTNKTFWTSDAPIVGDDFGARFFPLNSSIVLCVLERVLYEKLFDNELSTMNVKDRIYQYLYNTDFVYLLNKFQLEQCNRFVFACDSSLERLVIKE